MMMCQIKISFLLIIISVVLVKCDYYSSISGLENLLETEYLMIETLEKYLKAEEFKNSYLRNYLANVEHELEIAENNTFAYYENPINSFKALKRITRDWRDFYVLNLKLNNEEDYETSLKAWKEFQPNFDDLIGAAKGVSRLQQTYGLETSHIANGTLMGVKSSLEMHSSDCYDLGKSLLYANDTKNAVSWLIEARVKLAKETENNKVLEFAYLEDATIVDDLNNAATLIGNTKLAHLLAAEQLNKDQMDQPVVREWLNFTTELSEERLSRYRIYNKTTTEAIISTKEMYEKTCNGQLQQTPAEKRNLRCRYENNDVPFCLIAPFKVEELNLDPYVAYYHESIYESEIERIFAAAEENVERSRVGKHSVSEVRTSKNTWLWYHQHEFLNNLAQRLVDMTGLSLETAEALQVANYGIGGHYGPHYDFHEDEKKDLIEGNRVLTALFYINDVELGGATAFPYLRLAVEPIRRSLVMWYNLHESLELDYRTKHAGCPVIKGSKWICNEWFHSGDQEFYRPCDLEADGYKSVKFQNLK